VTDTSAPAATAPTTATSTPLLALDDVHVYYGGIHALKGVTIRVAEGEIVTLIGSNGAGKSTTLRTISGLLRPKVGAIHYLGASITSARPDQIVATGLVHSPEGRRIFSTMTVEENLRLGAYLRNDTDAMARDRDFVIKLFPRLEERRQQLGGTLSGGEQQMLAIGRALMSAPRLLMLDEPSLGIAPILVAEIFRAVRRLADERGMTILLVEQNARAALALANRAYVLETGRITMSGPAKDLANDPKVRECYLGG
jgi:branched-chain amino acid transport system ATP-binding protein